MVRAVKGGPKHFQALISSSPLAPTFFTPAAVAVFNSAINPEDRHIQAHLELNQPRLLSDALYLELVERATWVGDKRMSPASVGLRFLLLSWGAAVSRTNRDIIANSPPGTYYSLDADQLERLELFFN